MKVKNDYQPMVKTLTAEDLQCNIDIIIHCYAEDLEKMEVADKACRRVLDETGDIEVLFASCNLRAEMCNKRNMVRNVWGWYLV